MSYLDDFHTFSDEFKSFQAEIQSEITMASIVERWSKLTPCLSSEANNMEADAWAF